MNEHYQHFESQPIRITKVLDSIESDPYHRARGHKVTKAISSLYFFYIKSISVKP